MGGGAKWWKKTKAAIAGKTHFITTKCFKHFEVSGLNSCTQHKRLFAGVPGLCFLFYWRTKCYSLLALPLDILPCNLPARWAVEWVEKLRISQAGNFDWQHFCVPLPGSLAILYACVCNHSDVCVPVCVSVCVWGKYVSVCEHIAIFNKIVSAFIFGYAFHLFKTQTIVRGNKDTSRERWALGGSVASPIQAPIHIDTHTLLCPLGFPNAADTFHPARVRPAVSFSSSMGPNIVALFNAFAIAHCICWNFLQILFYIFASPVLFFSIFIQDTL